jgi:hypothetical protein
MTPIPVGRLGYYLPFAIVGAVLSTVGSGLFSLISPTTPTVAWAAYQVILGLARGASTQPVRLARTQIKPKPYPRLQDQEMYANQSVRVRPFSLCKME